MVNRYLRVDPEHSLQVWQSPGDGSPSLEWREGMLTLVRRWQPAGDPWGSVVVVHGLAEHSGRYRSFGAWLAAHGVAAVAADLPGHGGSQRGHQDLESFRGIIRSLLGEVGALPGNTALFGHSVGGLLVLDYLAVGEEPEPDLIMLSAPALDLDVPGWKRWAARILGRVLPGFSIPNDVDPEHLSRDPSVGERYLADPLVTTGTSAGLGLEMLKAMERVEQSLPFRVPALVIHGEDDEIVPPHLTERLAASESVTRILYPGLRHEILNEPEGEVVAGLFLTRLREAA